MKIVLEGGTVDTLLAELDMATTLLRGTGGAMPTLPPSQPIPPAVATTTASAPPPAPAEPPKPEGAAPTRKKRRTKEQKAFDDAHGISLKERRKIDEMKDGDPNLTDEAALAVVRGGAAPAPQPTETPPFDPLTVPPAAREGIASPAPGAVTLPGVPAPPAPPANPMAALTVPPAPAAPAAPGVPTLQADGSIAPAAPAAPAAPSFDLPQHANPAPGSPVTDTMLQNAFVTLQTNVSREAALELLSQTGFTQIADIPMEARQPLVDRITEMVRAAG